MPRTMLIASTPNFLLSEVDKYIHGYMGSLFSLLTIVFISPFNYKIHNWSLSIYHPTTLLLAIGIRSISSIEKF